MATAKKTTYMFKNTSSSAVKVGDALFSMTVPAGEEREVPESLVPAAKILEKELKETE